MSESENTAQTQEQAPKAKAKAKTSTNLLLDIATEVEGLSKTKALHLADNLAEHIEEDYFRLGGVLKLISENSWFEGFDSFDAFVFEKYGFQGRKARYLISIYTELVTKQIPWEKVGHLGWTKLKELAPILTLENVDEWVTKATPVSVIELIAMLKAKLDPSGEQSGKTSDDVTTLKFKVKPDQLEVVQAALAKAKGEIGTDYDTVALENICAGYVGGVVTANQTDLKTVIKAAGWEAVLTMFGDVYPEIDLTVKVPE